MEHESNFFSNQRTRNEANQVNPGEVITATDDGGAVAYPDLSAIKRVVGQGRGRAVSTCRTMDRVNMRGRTKFGNFKRL